MISSVAIDSTLDISAPGVLANDMIDSDSTLVTSFSVNSTVYNAGDTANLAEGSLTLLANGSLTFTPSPGFSGDVNPVSYDYIKWDKSIQL